MPMYISGCSSLTDQEGNREASTSITMLFERSVLFDIRLIFRVNKLD